MRGFSHKGLKPSGIAWLGDVPGGWDVKRFRSALYERREKYNRNEELMVLSLLKDVGVIPYSEKGNIGNRAKEDYSQYKVARKGDLVINSMNVIIGSVGITPYDGYISPAYYSFAPREDVCLPYYGYLCSTRGFQKAIRCYAKGIMEIRLRVSSYDFLSMPVPVPPLPEQEAIVKCLDEATGKIDKAIAAEEKMVALLQERREIVINEAVLSRGWRGAKRLKTILSETRDLSTTGKELPLSLTATDGIIPFSKKKNRTLENDTYVGTKIVRKGQIVFNRFRARLFAVSGYDGLVSPDYAVFSVGAEADARYLVYMFNTMAFKAQLNLLASGIGDGFSRVYAKDLLSVSIQLPPLPEQEAIVKRLDEETGKIDRAIAVKRRQIELLRERREIIINEVVTGKVKVA